MEIVSEEPGFKIVRMSDVEISLLSVALGYLSSEYDALDTVRLSLTGITEEVAEKLSDEVDKINGIV